MEIKLDDDTLDWVNGRHIYVSGGYLAVTDGKGNDIFIHRYVMGDKEGFDIDHKNRDKFDCRRKNLRHVSKSVNSLNKKMPDNLSGFRGVTTGVSKGIRKRQWWKARLTVEGVVYSKPTRYNLEIAIQDRLELESLYLPPELNGRTP